jgi:hypothetical protein
MCSGAPTHACLEQRPGGHFDHGIISDSFVAADGTKYRYRNISKSWKRHARSTSRRLDGDDATGLFHEGEFVGFKSGYATYWQSDGFIPPLRWVAATAALLLATIGLAVYGQRLADRDPESKKRLKRLMAERR